jgi:hypothetical protein
MRTRLLLVGWTLVAVSSAAAQRRVRVGPVAGIIGLEDAAGRSHRFTGFGGSAALITGDDGETGLSVARYSDLSTDGRVRRLTLYALDSHYYPVGTRDSGENVFGVQVGASVSPKLGGKER